MLFAKAFFPRMKSLLCVPLQVTRCWSQGMLASSTYSLWFTAESPPLVWQDKLHSPLYRPASFPWRSLPLLWFYSRFFKPIKLAITTSSLSGTLCWQLSLFFKESWGWISLPPSAGQMVWSWLHRDSELVSWHPLLEAYYDFFCLRPSLPIQICFEPGWDLYHEKQESNAYCNYLLVGHSYWCGCTFTQRQGFYCPQMMQGCLSESHWKHWLACLLYSSWPLCLTFLPFSVQQAFDWSYESSSSRSSLFPLDAWLRDFFYIWWHWWDAFFHSLPSVQ